MKDLNFRKAKIRKEVLKKHSKSSKIDYLMQTGIFDRNTLWGMDEKQINDLMNSAMITRGF